MGSREKIAYNCVMLKEIYCSLFLSKFFERYFIQQKYRFRKCKWKLRLRMEDEDDIITIRRSFSDTKERINKLRERQQLICCALHLLRMQIDQLATVINNDK